MLHLETVPQSTLDLVIELCALPQLSAFALAGGTALALRFGHRKSIDLDFFCPQRFDSQKLADELRALVGFEATNVNSAGTAGSIRDVKCDFVCYRYELLEPYETIESVRLHSLRDNIAMKLSAMSNRGAKKDFFDVHRLIREFGLPSLLEMCRAKYALQEPFIVLRSLVYFDDAEPQFDPESLDGTTWDQVKEDIRRAVKPLL